MGKDLLNGYIQHWPFSIQIEPTEGCNLGCSFCGIRGMREKGTKPWYFMSIETAVKISSEIKRAGWKSKIIFAMHGEPTLNPDLLKIIQIFRKNLPNNLFYIITNGYGIANSKDIAKSVNELKLAGINHLLLDNYSEKGDWNKIVKAVEGTEVIETLGKGIPMFSAKKDFSVLIMPPIYENKLSLVRNLVNHAGCAAPLEYSTLKKRCTMPFREMAFRYDGGVALCCDDFRGTYPISNIYELPIEDIWNHERFQAARIMLYNNKRNFKPCLGCTNLSMRVGLIPDPTGQDSLPEITKEVRDIANNVTKENKPLSKIIIKRKWEK